MSDKYSDEEGDTSSYFIKSDNYSGQSFSDDSYFMSHIYESYIFNQFLASCPADAYDWRIPSMAYSLDQLIARKWGEAGHADPVKFQIQCVEKVCCKQIYHGKNPCDDGKPFVLTKVIF